MDVEARRGTDRPLVLVTGSTGLIGARFCEALRPDYTSVGMDLEPPEGDGPDHWQRCDLTDDESVAEALSAVRREHGPAFASVVHLAAYYDFSGEPSPLYEQLTVEGTRRLIRGLRGFEIGQLVFASSLLVLKPLDGEGRLDEGSPTQAEWEYPDSKLRAERVIRDEHGGTPAVVLRIAGVYDEECHSPPIAQQIRRIHEKRLESYLFPGNPHTGQSFVHLDDLVACMRAVVERRGELSDYEVFLVGEPEVMTYAELQDLIGEELHGREWPTIRIPAPVAKAGAWVRGKLARDEERFIKPWMVDLADAHMPISISRAGEKLGWSPEHSLERTLPTMLRRLRADPAAWYAANGLKPPEGAPAGAEHGAVARAGSDADDAGD